MLVKGDIPLYKQSYGYSCGPAAILMVMSRINREMMMSIQLEDSVWDDANLVESKATSGHGLALAALKRGFKARIITDTDGIPFGRRLKEHFPAIDMKNMEKEFQKTKSAARKIGLEEIKGKVDIEVIKAELERGIFPIVLISTRLMWEIRPIPHWIVVLSVGKKHVHIANPEHGRIERYSKKRFEKFIGFDGQTCLLSVFD